MFMVNKYALLLLLGIGASVSSCKEKTEIAAQPLAAQRSANLSTGESALVEEAKTWYASSAARELQRGQGNSEVFSIETAPLWEQSFFQMLPDNATQLLRVPLAMQQVNCRYTRNMAPYGFRDLALRKEGENWVSFLIEMHPDSAYIASRAGGRYMQSEQSLRALTGSDDFTGYFLVLSSQTGALQYGERRENNTPVARIDLSGFAATASSH
jgi:hypothetical protein